MELRSTPDIHLAMPRIRRWTAALSAIGATALTLLAGPSQAAGFLVGCGASFLNLQLLHAVVDRLGPNPKPGRKRIISLFAVRYFGLAALAYVTLRVFGANPAAFIAGLLVATFAMLLDSVFELFYAGT